ncbi:Detected protein of confused Function [Hibiscus syriacus]|uniref:Detected protein of confused Function n=1 Tax=Hibiscus syriacus TaxID=106335 RepID=A0A6A2WCT2_HIBSY|nr:Detected protein of confused Function [Hibiscus syriacus]
MEPLSSQAAAIVSSSFSIFSPKRKDPPVRTVGQQDRAWRDHQFLPERMTDPVRSNSPPFHGLSSPSRRVDGCAWPSLVCGQRTTRAINPHAYNDGTVFVQCCGCNVFHELVDNLNMFRGMKCYVNPSFDYQRARQWNVGFSCSTRTTMAMAVPTCFWMTYKVYNLMLIPGN